MSVTLSHVMEDHVLRVRRLLDFGEKPYPWLLTSYATGGLLSKICFASWPQCVAVQMLRAGNQQLLLIKIKSKVILYPRIFIFYLTFQL